MTEQVQIEKALVTIAQATNSCSSKWVIGGSAGLMLRGIALPAKPRDLDLYCDEEDAQVLYEHLRDYAIDEPVVSVTDIYRSRLGCFTIHNVQVELVAGFEITALDCRYEINVNDTLFPYGKQIQLTDGVPHARIVPLAHELWFNFLRGRADRVQLIANAFADHPDQHEGALQAIEANNSFTEIAKHTIRRLLVDREAGGLE